MAFGGVVNVSSNTVSSGAITVTFPAATAGNLLVFVLGRSTSLAVGQTWGTPSGWTDGPNTPANTGNVSGAVWWKIAAGGETSVASAESAAPGNATGAVIEYEGPFAVSPFDVSAENESNLSTAVTSEATGTTASTAQADALAVGMWSADAYSNVDGTRTYSNSFTEDYFPSHGFTARAAAIAAHKVLSATGAQSCTFGCTDTGDEMYGAILVFKKQAAAGNISVTPAAAACLAKATNPGAVLGPILIGPAAAVCVTRTTSPAVALGALTITGLVASAVARVLGPQVLDGSELLSVFRNFGRLLFRRRGR